MYRIKDWYQLFENNRTRELKRMDWVPVPNRMDGAGYTALVDHPNGAAHLGAWLAMIEISSRQKVRGTFPQEGAALGVGLSQVLARISRLPAALFDEVLPRLAQIGWIELDREIPQEGAGIPQEGAGIPQEGAVLTRDTRAGALPFRSLPVFDFESKKENFLADDSIFPDWWQTWSAVRGTHHSREALQAWLSVVPMHLESAALECTVSYLASLDNPAKGFNPHTFLFDQAKEMFQSRWPANGLRILKRETRSQRLARLSDEREGVTG